jgi:hypothetical protein
MARQKKNNPPSIPAILAPFAFCFALLWLYLLFTHRSVCACTCICIYVSVSVFIFNATKEEVKTSTLSLAFSLSSTWQPRRVRHWRKYVGVAKTVVVCLGMTTTKGEDLFDSCPILIFIFPDMHESSNLSPHSPPYAPPHRHTYIHTYIHIGTPSQEEWVWVCVWSGREPERRHKENEP